MRTLSRIFWIATLAACIGIVVTAGDAQARGKRSKDSKKISVVKLKLGEPLIVPARNFMSVSVDKPRIVKARLNRRRGRMVLIPRRRGKAILSYKMKLPRHKKPIKGKIKLIVR